jgi:redox-sensitive bicupin YhaK (pirin superfamily)
MPTTRKIKKVLKSKPTLEGAGVHLKRVFGFKEAPMFDPFLLLDDFRSDTPDHYIKGFPWHPHRGIETITYVLAGDVEHGDSLGNKGLIGSGDVQWMMDPRYRDVTSEQIPEVKLPNGAVVRVISGEVSGTKGPVQGVVIDPEYIDVTVPANSEFRHPTKMGHTVFAYIIDGRGCFCMEKDPFTYEVEGKNYFDIERDPFVGNGTLVLFDDGDEMVVSTEEKEVRFLLISGKPIGEPVAWYGPIVMNTQEELRVAFDEYRQGTFIKHKG